MRRKLKLIKDFEKAIQQGYGLGVGAAYKPWIGVRDVPSRGRSTKYQSLTVGRIHHTFSDLETSVLCLADFHNSVVDIREQFPLFPLNTVQSLAENLEVRYPTIPGTSTPAVMTTDLLLTMETEGNVSYLAISVKTSGDLKKNRTREKLDIERVFWQSIGVEWLLATEIEISKTVSENLVWINSILKGDRDQYRSVNLSPLLDISAQMSSRTYAIEALMFLIMESLPIEQQEAKFLLCKAIWEHVLIIDLHQSIEKTGLIRILKWNCNAYSIEEDLIHGLAS